MNTLKCIKCSYESSNFDEFFGIIPYHKSHICWYLCNTCISELGENIKEVTLGVTSSSDLRDEVCDEVFY